MPIMSATVRKSRMRDILKPWRLITAARSSEVDILDTSAGWKRTGPKANHEREPLTSTPRKITATSRPRTSRYVGKEMTSHSFGLTAKRIKVPSTRAVRIHTTCFPLREDQAKNGSGSAEWIEA